MPVSPKPPPPSRRDFLDWVISFCGAVTGAALALPALAYLWPVTKTGPVKSREEAGKAKSWGAWEARTISVGGKPVLVIKTDKGFVALSKVCTHLGCLVEFDPAKRDIVCPCHGATFDLKGNVLGGPPPRPLPPYQVAETQGVVYVSG